MAVSAIHQMPHLIPGEIFSSATFPAQKSSWRASKSPTCCAIDSLVAKSMLAVHLVGAMALYRLLDTTRAYALDIGLDAAEAADLAVRHATHYRRWLEQSGTEWAMERAPHFAGLNNVRAALEWCFGKDGNAVVGIELAVAAAPVFLTMSLLPECHAWSERALLLLDERHRGASEEMQLQASLGLSLMYSSGHGDATRAALNRAIEIAKARGDHLNEVRLLGSLLIYNLRSGEVKICSACAKRSSEIAATLGDPGVTALAHTLMGISLTVMADLSGAQSELDAAREAEAPSVAAKTIHFGFDRHRWARVARIPTLCLQGYPDQARAAIKEALKDIGGTSHPASFAIVCSVAAGLLWIGDLDAAEEHLDGFISRAQSESFEPYLHVGHAFKGELAICRGEVELGVEILQSRLERLHAARYELFTVRLQAVLARGLAAMGQWAEALTLLDEAERLIEEKGYACYLAECLRLRGSICLAAPERHVENAEKYFLASLELSRAQGARAWELRTATDLAAQWAGQGRAQDARALLRPVVVQFTEGQDTPDLRAAKSLLAELDPHGCGPLPD